jgi:AmmeMemoRadiSam system protein A
MNPLTLEERNILLRYSRDALVHTAHGRALSRIDIDQLPLRLQQLGASFVTLSRRGELRGCIGALVARIPLVEDVREHTVAAASQDYRFPPVTPGELMDIRIEISRLSPTKPLLYENPQDLIEKLRPNVDGLIIMHGMQRATFLPQVWKKIQEPADFLSHLCLKMGAPKDFWRTKVLQVETYQVEEFEE